MTDDGSHRIVAVHRKVQGTLSPQNTTIASPCPPPTFDFDIDFITQIRQKQKGMLTASKHDHSPAYPQCLL